jgi:alpha-tubulin suppressor-like RCC1 family protein
MKRTCLFGVAVALVIAGALFARPTLSAASTSPQIDAGSLASVTSLTSDPSTGTTCALLSTGKVDCWGNNPYGELGNGTTTNSDVPVAAKGITNAKAVTDDFDGDTFCAVLSTDHVDCWGYNGYGELGDGNTTTSDVPVAVRNVTTATSIVGGINGFCVVLSNSHLDCWGYNGYGELGDGGTTSSDVPVAVHLITNASKVVSGYYAFCAVLATASVDCWGYNGYGQLGNGNTSDSDVPVAVVGMTNAKLLTSDPQSGTTCALLSTGRVDCWGADSDGELGNGSLGSSDVPVAALGITNAKALTDDFDGDTFCAVLSTGAVDCWGENNYGELGNGNLRTYTIPVAVRSVTTASSIVGGDYGFCVVLSNDHLDCWGYNSYGDLGDGGTTSSDVPVAVHVITNASKVVSGYYAFCAVLTTAHADCWGYGSYGQLGNGSTTSSDVPVSVTS